ncbi:MAG: hypothetical protein ACO3JL_13915 [Myxococcota bacterium]
MRLLLPLFPIAFAGSCGGVGVEAPYVIGPDEAPTGTCSTTEEATAMTRRALEDGRLEEFGGLLRSVLFDEGGFRIVLPVVRETAARLPPGEFLRLADGYVEGEGLARLTPRVIDILQYIAGTHPAIPGEHYGVVTASQRVLTRCDAGRTLVALQRLLDLEVVLADGTKRVWIDVAFDAFVDVAEEPAFRAFMRRLEFSGESDDAGNSVAVGRDAFVLLSQLVVGNVAAPGFDLEYLRGVLDDVLIRQLADENAARAKVTKLLDLIELILEPEAQIFSDVQALMECADRQDSEGELAGTLYDFLSTEALEVSALLADLDAFGADPAGDALRVSLTELGGVLGEEPALTRDLAGVVGRLLTTEAAPIAVNGALELRGRGVFTELVALFRRLLDGPCP